MSPEADKLNRADAEQAAAILSRLQPDGPKLTLASAGLRLQPAGGGLVDVTGFPRESTRRDPDRALPRDSIYRRLLGAADLLAGASAVVILHAMAGRSLVGWGFLAVPMLVLLAKLLGRYDRDALKVRRSTLDEAPALITLAAIYAVIWSVLTPLRPTITHLPGDGIAILWVLTSVLLIACRACARLIATVMCPPERVLIIGSAQARAALAHSLSTDPSALLNVVGFLPLEDERRSDTGNPSSPRIERRRRNRTFGDLATVASELEVDRVLLLPTTADNDLMLEAVTRTLGLGLNVSIVPRLFEVVGSAVEFDMVGGLTLLGVRSPGLSRSSLAIKRAMDLVGASCALLIAAPVFLVAAAAIKLDSPGPVFFRQRRVGRDGELFEMLKFRSMVDGAERQRHALEGHNETAGLFKIVNDPRITRVGRLLRGRSIDELPQLINVLRGDMSLVGPRPLVIAEDALIEGRHRERLRLAPGMTGPWQVLGPVRPPLSEMVKTDYLYATTWSLWADIKIMLRTAAHIVGRRGH